MMNENKNSLDAPLKRRLLVLLVIFAVGFLLFAAVYQRHAVSEAQQLLAVACLAALFVGVWLSVSLKRTGELAQANAALTIEIAERKWTEEALKLSEERFRIMFEQAPLGIALIDSLTGRINEVNPRFAEIAGRTKVEMEQIDWMTITHSDDVQEDLDNMARLNAGEISGFQMNKRYLHPDGAVVWISMTITPVTVENLTQPRHLCMIEDITERKRAQEALRESEEKYRRLFEDAAIGVFHSSFEGRFIDVNPALARMLGYASPREVIDSISSIAEQIYVEPPKRSTVVQEALTRGEAIIAENNYRRKDGTTWFGNLILRYVMDANGQPQFLEGFVEDITDRKRAEEEIQRLNATLEQRVIERTAQMEAANKELEAFAYSVSHDLRAPLRHINGYAGMLDMHCRDTLGENGLRYLDNISDSAHQMGKLIDDLLHFSRTNRSEILQENLDMNQVLQETLALIKERNSDRAIEWVIGDLPSVRGDYALLRQVWANLLENAVKYTRTRENARIEVSAARENGEIIFAVADNGVGFDMQYTGKLFGVFQRLHSSHEFEGTGIGLATVQRIIVRHGGRIWADAELNKGATFLFTLPAGRSSPA